MSDSPIETPDEGPYAILFDMTRCGGCYGCVRACMEKQGFEGEPEEQHELSTGSYCAIGSKDDYSYRKLCRHCVKPSCASACPAGALKKTAAGPVVYDADKCMGCRYCLVACPYSVPRYEWNEVAPRVRKCDMCYDRIAEGKITACADACRYGATVFGRRADLIAEAWNRIGEDPDEYHPHVYGEHELGGTSVLYLTPFPLEELGFRADLGDEPMPAHAAAVLDKLPGFSVTACAGLMALAWIIRRRNEVQALEVRAARASRRKHAEEVHHAVVD